LETHLATFTISEARNRCDFDGTDLSASQGQGKLNQIAMVGLLQYDGVNNKCQFQAICLRVLIPHINQIHSVAPFQRSYQLLNYIINYQHVMERKG
jgi:hypothetical protein